MEEVRNKVYNWSLELLKEGKELQGIILMLSTWNFAYFRYHIKTFDLTNFERILRECDFEYFRDKRFEDTDFNDEIIKSKIMQIYQKLSEIIGIRYVGATKIMHLKCPKFFMMWDNKIIYHYKTGTSPEDYLNFMKKTQELYKKGEFGNLDKEITIPRAIDIYNMDNYSEL